jgi:hypothetical protein
MQSAPENEAINGFARLLADYEDFTIEEFCQKARVGLEKKTKAKKTPASTVIKKPDPSAFNQPAVERYVGELEQTKTDSRQFEKIIERMKKDKEIRVAEAREIASRFMRSSKSFKTKPEAVKAILQRQITDVRADGKAERIGDIF